MEHFILKSDAIKRESQLKKWKNRSLLEQLILEYSSKNSSDTLKNPSAGSGIPT